MEQLYRKASSLLTEQGFARARALIAALVVVLVVLVIVVDAKRRSAESKLRQLSVQMEQLQTGNTEENKAIARDIVNQVRRHIVIPADVEPTVATIVDVNALRERNPFYEKAKNGDHLVITPTRAILYDPNADVILDVVPVQIQAPEPAPKDGMKK